MTYDMSLEDGEPKALDQMKMQRSLCWACSHVSLLFSLYRLIQGHSIIAIFSQENAVLMGLEKISNVLVQSLKIWSAKMK